MRCITAIENEVNDVSATINGQPEMHKQLNRSIHGELNEIEVWSRNFPLDRWVLQAIVYET